MFGDRLKIVILIKYKIEIIINAYAFGYCIERRMQAGAGAERVQVHRWNVA